MRAVQRESGERRHTVASWLLTCVAALLVLAVLTAPNGLQLSDLGPGSFLRLPLEPLVFLAVLLILPPQLDRVLAVVAVAGGLLLGVIAVFKVLDLGFLEAFDRRFDALVDWRHAGALIDLVRDSVGDGLGTVLLVAAGLAVVALLVSLPLSVVRISRVAARHRRPAVTTVAALAALWLALALLDVRVGERAVASRDAASYVYGQLSRIPSELRDERRFQDAVEQDPYRETAREQLLTGLRGKDVLIVFVESFGRVAVEGSSFSPGVNEVLDTGTQQLARAGFASRSAFLTSSTFGGLSWLAHSTLQSGLWVDSQQRYDVLMSSSRLTLSRLFARAGWRTVAVVPANDRDWPEGSFYGYDHIYDARNIGYRGPRFGYPTMPDQYTLDAFHRLELAREPRPPVMAEIDLLSSHAPWSQTPRLIEQSAVGDGSVYDGMPGQLPSKTDIWSSPARVRTAYGDSIEYSLNAFLSFMAAHGDDDLVVVLLGDHQPATIVSGDDAGHDVPVVIIAADLRVLDRIAGWGWDEGLRPDPGAPVWRMDLFRDRFLAAYGLNGNTGTRTVSGR